MGMVCLTYNYYFLVNGILSLNFVSISGVINPVDTPYHLILYSVLVIALVYWLVRSQTRTLIKTRKLLKEKEQAIELIGKQKIELELRDKNMTDSLIYAQRIQEALLPSEV